MGRLQLRSGSASAYPLLRAATLLCSLVALACTDGDDAQEAEAYARRKQAARP